LRGRRHKRLLNGELGVGVNEGLDDIGTFFGFGRTHGVDQSTSGRHMMSSALQDLALNNRHAEDVHQLSTPLDLWMPA
jgi:hypothetical protein